MKIIISKVIRDYIRFPNIVIKLFVVMAGLLVPFSDLVYSTIAYFGYFFQKLAYVFFRVLD